MLPSVGPIIVKQLSKQGTLFEKFAKNNGASDVSGVLYCQVGISTVDAIAAAAASAPAVASLMLYLCSWSSC